jgi:catalase
MISALTPPSGAPLGHRRNHAKGICFTGVFEANGNGAELSSARVFERGAYPALGRFNLGTADPNAVDATVRVRGLGLQIAAAGGEEWRMALINPPFFAVSTPQAFHDLLIASGKKDPEAMKMFIQANPEFTAFATWAKTAPWTASYAEEPYHGLNSFIFTDAKGGEHVVRWSLLPTANVVPISQAELHKRGPDFLEQEIVERVRTAGPQRWTMVTTVADPGDPTADPSKAWPEGRRTVQVGTLVVQRIEQEQDGPAATSTSIRRCCREESGCRTILSRRRARQSIASPTICVRPKPATIREPGRPSHEQRAPSFRPDPAAAALADGSLHHRHALHRRRHGLHRGADISAAHPDPQDARRHPSGPRCDQAGAAAPLRRATVAG